MEEEPGTGFCRTGRFKYMGAGDWSRGCALRREGRNGGDGEAGKVDSWNGMAGLQSDAAPEGTMLWCPLEPCSVARCPLGDCNSGVER